MFVVCLAKNTKYTFMQIIPNHNAVIALRTFLNLSGACHIVYPARPHQVIFNLLFSHPASLRSLADAQASSTFRASHAEKIAASKFHLLRPRGVYHQGPCFLTW